MASRTRRLSIGATGIALALAATGCPADFHDVGDDGGTESDGTVPEGSSGGGTEAGKDAAPKDASGGDDGGVRDAGSGDDGAGDDAATDGMPPEEGGCTGPQCDASTCTSGDPCLPGTCQLGKTECDAGVSFCAPSGHASDGTSCSDAGSVCSGGTCVACAAGTDCSEAGSCQQMQIECSSGPKCAAAGNKPNGSPCGTNLYCNAGNCAPCTGGAPCTPSSNPCHKGTASCSTGQISCTDTMANADDGTPCGTNQVCKAGQCVACTAGLSCNPGGNVCQTGKTSCAGGVSSCVATGSANDGTPCDDGNACTTGDRCLGGSCGGAQVTCTAMDQCHGVGTCDTSTGKCSNPTLPNTTSCDDGNKCTTGDKCNSGTCAGTAVTCTASDQCHGVGTCDTSTGQCSNPVKTGSCDDGNGCTTGDTCSNGTCTGTPKSCPPPDGCHTAGTCSNGSCGGYGNACGANMTCQGGSCQCSAGLTSCNSVCVNTNTDNSNCGHCLVTCPAVAGNAGGGSSCGGGVCTGYIGGYASAGGTVGVYPTSFAEQGTMPNQNGTFAGIGARMGSTDSSGGTTSPGFAVYADNTGSPGQLLWSGSATIANPSSVTTIGVSAASGSYQNGWTGNLVKNAHYWVAIFESSYNGGGGGSGGMVVAETTSGPCLSMSWINGDAPTDFSGSSCNAAPVALYITATFP